MGKLLLIDGSSMLSTAYYATLPPTLKFGKLSDEDKEKEYKKLLQTKTGIYTNGVYTMFKTFLKIYLAVKPSHVAITWDVSRKTFRKELFDDYKGTRKPSPEPLKQQFATAQDFFKLLGVQQFMSKEYEADDFAGSIAKQFESSFDEVLIFTKDQDYLQLVSGKTTIMLGLTEAKVNEYLAMCENKDIPYVKELSGQFPFDRESLKSIYGLTPSQIVDWKAISGDASDNIPGIKGIGPDTAVMLLKEFGTLKKLQEFALSEIDDKAFAQRCKDIGVKRSPRKALLNDINVDHLGRLSYQLAKIKTDIGLLDDNGEAVTAQTLKFALRQDLFEEACKKLEFNLEFPKKH